MKTALIWNETHTLHNLGMQKYTFSSESDVESGIAFENPRRINLVYELLEHTGLLNKMKVYKPYKAQEVDILKVHSERLLKNIKNVKNVKKPTEIGESVFISQGSYEASLLSAGGAMKAIDVLFEDKGIEQSYALIRPPGHHATYDSSMGFCIFNNVAVAASHAQDNYGVEKIFIIDWDVHHGNGTQDIFYENKNVFFTSIHQDKNYPIYGGEITEIGQGSGKGFNLNVPLMPGCGNKEYLRVLEEIIKPAVKSFQPDLILVSAGQDSNLYDPLSRMMVTREGFNLMMKKVRQLASQYCDGKLAVFQEGGYSLPYFPIATLGLVEGLLNQKVDWEADIEKQIPYNAFHPNIDYLLSNIKNNFSSIYTKEY